MEVKDVRSAKLATETKVTQLSTLKALQVKSEPAVGDAVKKDLKSNKSQIRVQLNDVINATNVAKEATTQISRIVQSISGIIKQASKDDIPEQRRATLEKEANDLVAEIKRTAETEANGVKPLAGDKIRLEVEEKIGKTLDVILPDDAKNAFGLTELDFSTKDSIIATIANVKEAEESINRLKQAVEAASKNIESTAGQIDVALQNSEAAESTIRDLDQALQLAGATKSTISKEPKAAMESLGKLGADSLGLLE